MRDGSEEPTRADEPNDEGIIPDLTDLDPELGDLLDLLDLAGPPPEPLPVVERTPLPHRLPPPHETETDGPVDGLEVPHFVAADPFTSEPRLFEDAFEPELPPPPPEFHPARIFTDEEVPSGGLEGPTFIERVVEAHTAGAAPLTEPPEPPEPPEPEPPEPEPEPELDEPEPEPPKLPTVPVGELDGFAVQLGDDLGASPGVEHDARTRGADVDDQPTAWFEAAEAVWEDPIEAPVVEAPVVEASTEIAMAIPLAGPTVAEITPTGVERLGPSPCVEPVSPAQLRVGNPPWRRHLVKILVILAAAAALAALLLTNPRRGGDDESSGSPSTSQVPVAIQKLQDDPSISLVAEAAIPLVDVYEAPNDSRPAMSLEHRSELGAPLVFLVKEHRGEWLEVYLPVRPSGSRGWVKTEDVRLSKHDYKIEVRLGEHRLALYKADEIKFETAVAIGTRDTPAPGGVLYIRELLKPPNPDTVYGDYAFGLSGFSEGLDSFNEGEGVVGIHGTNDISAIGDDVSLGSIRMTNEDMLELVGTVPLGTPVEILP